MNTEKIMSTKSFKRGEMLQLIIEIIVIAIIFVSNSLYVHKQNQLYQTSSTLSDLEYLSAATQRLSKLVMDGQEIDTLYSFLDVEHLRLLSDDTYSGKYEADSEKLLQSWLSLKECVDSSPVNLDMLQLVSDNHYFIVSSFSSRLLILEDIITHDLLEIKWFTHFTAIILLIILSYRGRRTRIESIRNKAMQKIAEVDQATGLFNRSKCQEIFQKTPNSEKTSGFVVIDLNDLKKINDTQGHRMGDALIRSFALALTTCAEHSNNLPFLGRYGGDEFVVFFETLEHESDVTDFLTHLADIVKGFNQKEQEFTIRYADGYAISPKDTPWTYQSLFDMADQNMYENKEKMKHGVVREKATITMQETTVEGTDSDTTFSIERKASLSHANNMKSTAIVLVSALALIYLFVVSRINSMDYIEGNLLKLPLVSTYEVEHDSIGLSNPWKNSSLVNMLLYRGLLLLDSNLTDVQGDLATGYELSEDHLNYTLTLENGLKWSDGMAITIEDVLFSIETFARLEDSNFYIQEGFSNIQGYDDFVNGDAQEITGITTTDTTISFQLNRQYGKFPSCLAQFVPLPKHKLEDYFTEAFALAEQNGEEVVFDETVLFTDSISSGMYQLSNEEGELFLIPNQYYNKEVSDIGKIALLSDYSHLDIDFYTTNDLSNMVYYRAIRGFTEYSIDQYTYRYVVFNLEGEEGVEDDNPMTDIQIRVALIQALNRPELLSSVYYDTGALVASGVINKELGNVVITDYNPEAAREGLEAAGYDFSRPLRIMYYHEGDKTQDLLSKMVEYFEAVGLTVELIYSDSVEEVFDVRPYDILLKGLSAFDYFDWYAELGSDSELLHKLLATKEYDPLIQELRECNSEEERMKIVEDLVALTMSCYYKVPLFTMNQSAYVNMTRVSVPDDMQFANTMYRYDIRFDEWSIRKSD